ncbi:MAG: ABC transporter permease [Pseudomonadota bacterium]
MSFRRVWHIIVKELIQVLRDSRMRVVLFLPPLIQLIAYGYAVNFDIRHIPVAIYDEDQTPQSRALIQRFGASEYFDLAAVVRTNREVENLLNRGDVTMVLHLPHDFARRIKSGRHSAPVQLILDGTDSNAAMVVSRYAGVVLNDYSAEVLAERMARLGPMGSVSAPIEIDQRAWFNSNLSSRYSFIPGVIAMVVMLVSLMLTAMAVVREKEIGTMEQIMVTPIRPTELMLGKTVPFVLIALVDVGIVTLVGIFWFGVPFRGSVLVLLLGTILFLFNSVGLGLFFSTISATQQQAMMASSFFFTPAILLSGFIFPIHNMPRLVQYITYLDPLRYFITVLQGIFLKGVGLETLWPQMAAMAALGVALLGLSVLRFRKRVA